MSVLAKRSLLQEWNALSTDERDQMLDVLMAFVICMLEARRTIITHKRSVKRRSRGRATP